MLDQGRRSGRKREELLDLARRRDFGLLEGVIAAVEDQFSEWNHPNNTLRRLCAITQDVVFRQRTNRRSVPIKPPCGSRWKRYTESLCLDSV